MGMMMSSTQEHEVVQVCAPSTDPVPNMMSFEPKLIGAAGMAAATVPQQECLELPFGDNPVRAAEIQDIRSTGRSSLTYRRSDSSATQQTFNDCAREGGATGDPTNRRPAFT